MLRLTREQVAALDAIQLKAFVAGAVEEIMRLGLADSLKLSHAAVLIEATWAAEEGLRRGLEDGDQLRSYVFAAVRFGREFALRTSVSALLRDQGALPWSSLEPCFARMVRA
jgi:hypothetical protein